MSIASLQFLGFVAITAIIYYMAPCKLQWCVLLIASVIFYVSFGGYGILLLLATAFLAWFCALQIQKSKDTEETWLLENRKKVDKEERKEKKAVFQKQQRVYVVLFVIVAIGSLFLCKYYGHMAKSINLAFGASMWTAENILLPLGISYYSLQLIGYVIDVSRGIIRAERQPLKVVLYGVFFLAIMQGPFNRYGELMPQVYNERRERCSFGQVQKALLRIAGGFIKKLCIADQVGIIATEVFSHYIQYSGCAVLLGMICFAVQLYADFSGYMDIVIGIGEIFGIRIPENFKQPFFSRSIQEFWQRWHITLGAWLKDYVFYPVLKSKALKHTGKWITDRFGKELGRSVPTYIGFFITWTLIGLWHGAGMNYVFGVGILQFLYIFLGEITRPVFLPIKSRLGIKEESKIWHVFQSCRCTVLMLIAWVFFKSRTFLDALCFFKQFPASISTGITSMISIFSSQAKGISGSRWQLELVYVFLCIVILFLLDYYHERSDVALRERILCQKFPVRLLCYLTLIFTILVFGAYGNQYDAAQFIYFDF